MHNDDHDQNNLRTPFNSLPIPDRIPTPEQEALKNDEGNRISKSVDCLWISGVLLINVATGLLFGAKYIGFALIGFFFVFTLCARSQIKERFPPITTWLYLYRDPSNFVSSKSFVGQQGQQKIETNKKLVAGTGCFFILAQRNEFFILAMESGMLISIVIINCIFLIWYRQLFISLNGDCLIYSTGVYRANKYGELAEYWTSSIAFLRPTGLIMAVVVSWSVALWSYANSTLWVSLNLGILMPIVVFLFLFNCCYVALMSMEQRQPYP